MGSSDENIAGHASFRWLPGGFGHRLDSLGSRTHHLHDLIEYDPQPPFDGGAPAKATADVKALANDFAARVDGGRRRALWPNGRKYDRATTG